MSQVLSPHSTPLGVKRELKQTSMKKARRKPISKNYISQKRITHQMPAEYEQLMHAITAMRNLIDRETINLSNANPQWDKARDARITVFLNILAVIDSAMVGLTFTKGTLPAGRFWSECGLVFHADTPEVVKAARRDIERKLEEFIKVGFIQVFFSMVESAIRTYLRALDPTACAGGTAEFQSIYKCLLKKLSAPIPDSIELLDLWREVRNVIHNNGIYFNRKGRVDKTIAYKGKTYLLAHGQKIDFVHLNRCFSFAFDVVLLLQTIVKDEIIKNHSGLILDPIHQ